MKDVTTKFGFLCSLACLFAAMAMPVQAGIITFTDRSAFEAAVSGETVIDFNSVGPTGVDGSFSSRTFNGEVTFSQGDSRLFILGEDVYSGANLSSAYLNHNDAGTQNVVVTFAGEVFAAGMELGHLENWAGVGGTTTFSLSTGDVFTAVSERLHDSGAQLNFIGWISDTGFDSIVIDDPSKGTVIDDFTYTSVSVPEPGTLGLLAVGLISLAGASMRRRRIGYARY